MTVIHEWVNTVLMCRGEKFFGRPPAHKCGRACARGAQPRAQVFPGVPRWEALVPDVKMLQRRECSNDLRRDGLGRASKLIRELRQFPQFLPPVCRWPSKVATAASSSRSLRTESPHRDRPDNARLILTSHLCKRDPIHADRLWDHS